MRLALAIFSAVLVLAPLLVLAVAPLRRLVLSRPLMAWMASVLPRMSATERAALEAGSVWWDGELFAGRPDWDRLLGQKLPGLSRKEEAFLEGPVRELCALAIDHEITRQGDLPPEVWEFLKRHRFFGMIIPEEYGGLGFSARAHSEVITRISSRSVALAVTVMVPNSLGPAELILHYGTEEQKRDYLPRLARGEEIPCFALTEPEAGSDAAGLRSTGVICRGMFQGREVLGIRLNWNKRYATLGPVATVIGLAFQLHDPDHLVGDREKLGITCALIPTDLPGIDIGARHDPLGVAFHNGPTTGEDVFVPVEFIIGGLEQAGRGWRMLMQSLAAGRAISLPSLSVGGAEVATRVAGAYATIREQFGLPIGRFEGIEEPLARLGGKTYLMNAARTVTASAVDLGEKPSVLSAVVKSALTEEMRQVVNDAMDILGGAGISRGPNNILAGAYTSLPIGITVEGANILTRSLIIFGQGALRCHPYALREMEAVAAGDVKAFDRALFGHLAFIARNAGRAVWLGLTGGKLWRPPVDGVAGDLIRRLDRMSACFALTADVAMGTLGGDLKRREKLSGRLADALTWLYLGTATVKRFVDDGRPERDEPYVRWAGELALHRIQTALDGFLDNLPVRPAAWLLRPALFPLGLPFRPPSDRLGHKLAAGLLEGREPWRALTRHIYVPPRSEPGLGRLEDALEKTLRARPVEGKMRAAVRAGRLEAKPAATLAARALAAEVIDAAEARWLEEARAARHAAIQVDAHRAATPAVQPV